MEGWQVSLIGVGVSILIFLVGLFWNSRNPQNLAVMLKNQQETMVLMQKEINELKLAIKPVRIKATMVIVVDEEVYVESQSVERVMIEQPAAEDRRTRPHGRVNGLGGMKS